MTVEIYTLNKSYLKMMELKFEGDDQGDYHKEALIPSEGIDEFHNQDHLYQLQQINTQITFKITISQKTQQ